MPSSEESKNYIERQLFPLEVSIRKMMGEYLIHFRGRILGFISDDQLILEDGPTLRGLLPQAERVKLFPGSRDFCLFSDTENSRFLRSVCESIYDDLPIPKPRKKKEKKVAGPASPSSDNLGSFPNFEKTSSHLAPKRRDTATDPDSGEDLVADFKSWRQR